MAQTNDIVNAIKPVTDLFEQLGIEYFIGGSVASSAIGIARSTLDVDVVLKVDSKHIDTIVAKLSKDYYISPEAIRHALTHTSSFNVIHLATGIKIDLFVFKKRPFDIQALLRKKTDSLSTGQDAPVFNIASPEDVILAKLEWYKNGNEIATKQLDDILGILTVQKDLLNFDYIEDWSKQLQLHELWTKVWNGFKEKHPN